MSWAVETWATGSKMGSPAAAARASEVREGVCSSKSPSVSKTGTGVEDKSCASRNQ